MDELVSADSIFSIFPERGKSSRQKMLFLLAGPFEYLFGLNRLKSIYKSLSSQNDLRMFMRQGLSALNINPVFKPQDKMKIPSSGPCVVISNHPFGMIEGIILTDLLLSIRPDVKIMANFLLGRIPQLRNLIIKVDPFEGSDSASFNIRPVREALRWVKQGGLLIVFPAGEVSQYKISRREVTDPDWKNSVTTIIRHAKPSIVPIFFLGQNSVQFQIAGLLHPHLRTMLLVRELLKQQGKQINFKIGNPISYQKISHYSDDAQLVDYLRWRTYIIGHLHSQSRILKLPAIISSIKAKCYRPPVGQQSVEVYRQEIEKLPPEQKIVKSGPFSVWQAQAYQIPRTLREIGRLREITFRLAGEGTNKPLDLDRFDAHYTHLFSWNEDTGEIVGAYRLGQTDEILATRGKDGLYVNTLFHSQMNFYEKLGPALELGRSFVRPEYQKHYSSLLLLWKGIGAFLVRHPWYRVLFGPVSISRDYSDLSRHLLATTLLRHSNVKDLAMMVRPRNPVQLKPMRIRGCNDIVHDVQFQDFKDVCSVISDIEIQRREIPVLLRQYLNLGGQLLSFNIDKSFSGVMDGLIIVELFKTEPKMMERYMGIDGMNKYLSYHSAHRAKCPAISMKISA